MALFSMDLESLKDLFIDELRDLYDAENQITEALPKLIEKAKYPQLKSALQEHLEVTRGQIQRLENIFERLQEKATGESCKGMKGLIKEGDDMAGRDGDSAVIDAAIISSAQRVEHYEIAGYGTVRTYAELLGEREMAQLLQQTLDEEKQADQTLNEIAKTINVQARAA
jgi:ferritin-like metal-binding protein YciE